MGQLFSFLGLRGKERVLSRTQNKNIGFPENSHGPEFGGMASQGPSHGEEARGVQLPASPLPPPELPPGSPKPSGIQSGREPHGA